jgi:hypothetical protein
MSDQYEGPEREPPPGLLSVRWPHVMPREGAIFNDVIGALGAPRAALLTIATAFLASVSAANSEDEALIRQLAEFEKTQGLITGYTANKEDYHLDVTISSTTPLPKGEASLTGRTTCYLGTRGLATKLKHTWTVQVFVPGEAPAAYTCEIPATQAETPPPHRKLSRFHAPRRRGHLQRPNRQARRAADRVPEMRPPWPVPAR